MTGPLELWHDGWDLEPCDTAPPDPDEQAHTDLHGRPCFISGDHGRPAGRATCARLRRIHTIKIRGDLL